MNGQAYRYSMPFLEADEPYRLFAFKGERGASASLDMSLSGKSVHGFAEAAINHLKKGALSAGVLFNPDKKMDIGLHFRHYSPAYMSPETQAFSQQFNPQNERGVFLTIRYRPVEKWVTDLYLDQFRFPWLRYQVDGAGLGREFQVQVAHTPRRGTELTGRFRCGTQWKNGGEGGVISNLRPVSFRSIRLQVQIPFGDAWRYRQRGEWVLANGQKGALVFVDLRVRPPFSTWTGLVRAQWVGTEGYESRIYAFENDVLYASSLTAFYNREFRYYLIFTQKMGKKIQLSFKFSQSLLIDIHGFGSGWAETTGNHRSELRVQISYLDVR